MCCNCLFNHPCPIFCPINLSCQGNEVINPVLTQSFGFFSNNDVGTIAANAIIPISLQEVSGDGISANTTTAGAINLLGGTYEISYFVQGIVPAGGTISTALRLNGDVISGSEIEQTQTPGDVVNMSKTIVFTTLLSGTLELFNSSEATTFDSASVFVRRL